MGQSQTNPFSENSPLMSEYRIEAKDLQYNQTYLTHLRTQKQFVLKEFTFNQIREFTIVSEKLKTRQKLHSNYLTKLKTMEQRTQDQMCSNFYKIYTLWDYPHRTLEQDIRFRSTTNNHYSNKQLFQILSSSIKGLKQMQQIQIKHQSLSTRSILMQKKGSIKVTDPLTGSFISNMDNLFNNRSSKGVYLSPQQCQSLQQQKAIIDKNPYKNDVFSLGMIILQCALLKSQNECYLQECSKVNWNQINLNLTAFGKLYNQKIKNIVQRMLNKDIKSRPDWIILERSIQNQTFTSNSNLNQNYPSPLTTIRSVESQNTNPQSTFRSNQFQNTQPQNNMANIHFQTPMLNTLKSVPSQKTGNFINVSPIPIVNTRKTEISSILAKSPMKQISFNIKSPGNLYTQPTTSISSPQPIRSTVYNNFSGIKIEKTPIIINSSTNQPILQNKNTTAYNFDGTFGGFGHKKQAVQLQFVQTNQIKRQSNRIESNRIQKETIYQQNQKVQAKQILPQLIKQQSQQPQFVEEFFKLGSRYEGLKLNGMRQGRGKFYYQDGGSYDGEWKRNKMNGQGTLYYQSNKKAYQGQWFDDQFHGQGTLYNENLVPLNDGFDYRNFDEIEDYWVYYKGEFKADSKHGYGILKFSNGEQFKGTFKQDMVEGEGSFMTVHQIAIHGMWSQNHLIQLLN